MDNDDKEHDMERYTKRPGSGWSRTTATLAVAILALGTPAAALASLDEPAGAVPERAAAPASPTSGFVWRDAAIGAGATGGLVAVAALGGLGAARLRRHGQVEQPG